MTKSTITRERLEQLADNNTICKVSWDERIELAQIALAAMDSEPVGSNYRKLFTCTGCGAEGLDEPLETNCHCCVDGAHWVESRLYRHAQPAPVVPEEMTPQQASRSYGGEVRGYRDGWNACRAAMLQAEPVTTANKLGNSPAQSDCYPAQNHVSPAQNQGWIPVSERIPIPGVDVLVAKEFFGPGDWRRKVGHVRHEDGGWNIYGASWAPTHWMPLPAAPQEVTP